MNQALVNEVFERMLALPPDQRGAALDRECEGDQELRLAVCSLLDALNRAGDFMASPTVDAARHSIARDRGASAVGSLIGPYKILEQIGEGGFGTVYMAEQATPIRRRVAIKVLKPGMDSRSVVGRFEAERQALALMDHPNIARVFEAGSTAPEHGALPYFVMELVRGVPITQYCDEARLTPRERLEILVPVCLAVQHAHAKGVIHRDLKPSNVLVTLHDGKPVPKIIDFGIAKATGAALTDKTVLTEFRALIGTPAYMSPEQAEMSGLDIDTRSDIYSLGVLMYELLTGFAPFDAADLARAGLAEMQRIIREQEPSRPSTRISTAGHGLRVVTDRRRNSPDRLARFVRGELDWIIMRAMEKDRSRRYPTADALAADISRFLSGEPVHAAPPSALYLVQKFVRRHRAPVLAAILVLIALAGGLIGTSWGLARASTERDQREVEAGRAGIAAASAALTAADGPAALRHLELVPQRQRGWAWNHLRARLNRPVVTIDPPTGVSFSRVFPVGYASAFAVGSDRRVRGYSIDDGRLLLERDAVGASGSSDGTALLLELADGTLRLEDLRTGVPRWTLAPDRPGSGLCINEGAFTRGGDVIVAGRRVDGAFVHIDAASGRILRTVAPAVTWGRPPCVMHDPAGGEALLVLPQDNTDACMMSMDGQVLPDPVPYALQFRCSAGGHVAGVGGGAVEIARWRGPLIARAVGREGERLVHGDISPDEQFMVTADVSGVVKLWRVPPRAEADRAVNSAEPIGFWMGKGRRYDTASFVPGARTVVAACPDFISCWSVDSAEEAPSIADDPRMRVAAFAPDGSRAYVGGWTDVASYDAHSGRKLWQTWLDESSVRAVALTPDGTKIAALLGDYGDPGSFGVFLLDAATGERIAGMSTRPLDEATPAPSLNMTEGPGAVCFSNDGSRLYVGGVAGGFAELEVPSLALVRATTLDVGAFNIARLNGGRLLVAGVACGLGATGTTDPREFWRYTVAGKLAIVDDTLRVVREWPLESQAVAVSPEPADDGSRAVVGFNGEIAVVDEMGASRRVAKVELGGAPRAAALSANGRTLAIGTDRATVCLVDLARSQIEMAVPARGSGVTALRFVDEDRALLMSAVGRPLTWLVGATEEPRSDRDRSLYVAASALAQRSIAYAPAGVCRQSPSARRQWLDAQPGLSEVVRSEARRLIDIDANRPVRQNESAFLILLEQPKARPEAFDQAVECASNAVRCIATHLGFRLNLGTAQLGAGMVADAENTFRWVLDHTLDRSKAVFRGRALLGLSLTLDEKGDHAAAVDSLEQATALLRSAPAATVRDRVRLEQARSRMLGGGTGQPPAALDHDGK